MKNATKSLTTLILLLSITATAVTAADRPNLEVSLLSYSPVPAEPGSYVTVTFKVLNDGEEAAPNAAIEFIDNYPFKIEGEKLKAIGMLGLQEDYLAQYRVRVDSAALQGTNYLKVRYTSDQVNWVMKEIALTIDTVQKTLGINSINMDPEVLSPGGRAKVFFKVKNMGVSSLRDVSLKLNLEGAVFGSTYVDIPLAPIGSSVEKRISLLETGQSADFEFLLQAYPEASSGLYKVPLTLTYTDEGGTEHSRQDLFGVPVNSEPDISVRIDDSTLYSDNGRGDVTFIITNKGLSEIKFLTVKLLESEYYSIKSLNDEVYAGNVDSDDYETAEFTIMLDRQGLGEVALPVRLTFKDALNEDYAIDEELTLQLLTSAEAGEESSRAGVIIAVVAVAIVIGFIFYRRWKCKRKK